MGEGIAAAMAQPVTSVVAALITAAVCATVLATTGQAAATEARILSEVDEAGSRTLVFSDPTGEAGLTAQGLDAVKDLPGAEWVVALGHIADVRNETLGSAGNPVPSRPLFTQLPPVVELTSGRLPELGEAIAGEQAILAVGMADGAGGVSGDTFSGPIVGMFSATEPLADLERSILIVAEPVPDEHVRSVYVVARSVNDVAQLEQAVPALLHLSDRTQLRTESPAILADLQSAVAGELGASSRTLMLVVLGAGLAFIAVTLYGATLTRRRDFGRRRALGASRSTVIVLVLTQTAFAATVGALLGTGAGLALLEVLDGNWPSWSFTLGVPVLAIVVALVAAVPPALAAALRDPVRILRVP